MAIDPAVDLTSDSHLQADLSAVELSFLTSAQKGENALAAFSSSWDSLEFRIRDASKSHSLDEETRLVAQSVSNNIAALAESLLSLQLAEEEILSSQVLEVDEILRGVQESDCINAVAHSSPSTRQPSTRRSNSVHTLTNCQHPGADPQSSDNIDYSPSIVRRTSRWLLKHLHNPYPPRNVKSRMAHESDVTVKAINNWFANARRKIGWTLLCKRHFQGNRHLTVDSARHIFLRGNESPLYTTEVVRDFWTMKTTAEKLYDEASVSSGLAKTLEAVDSKGHGPGEHNDITCSGKQQNLKRKRIPSASDDDTDIISGGSERDSQSEDATLFDYLPDDFTSRRRRRRRIGEGCEGGSQSANLSDSTSSKSISRSASLTFSASSRESTEEISTPMCSTADLPSLDFDSVIDKWLSSVSANSSIDNHEVASRKSRKRRMSDSDASALAKRQCTRRVEEASDLTSISQQAVDSLPETLPEFDFSIPPPVTMGNIFASDAVHLNTFDCAYWQQTELDESLFGPAGENLDVSASLDSNSLLEWLEEISSSSELSHSIPLSEVIPSTADVAHNAELEFLADCTTQCLPSSLLLSTMTPGLQDEYSVASVDSRVLDVPNASSIEPETSSETKGVEMLPRLDLAKLDHLNRLLAEAAELQREVFGDKKL